MADWWGDGLQIGKDQYETLGHNGIGRFYTVRFKGTNGLAMQRCKRALQLWRHQDGTWKTFAVVC